MRNLFLIGSLLFSLYSFANNPGVSYQGRIIKPDGTPLEGSSVQFRMQVRSPGSENCLLYEEIQSINMSGSSGVFAITLNDGSGTRIDAPTYQVDRIFANRDTMTLDSARCAVGTTYVPNSGDGRKFVVYFKDETMTAYEPLPIMSLNYAPQAMYALEAQKIDKFPVSSLLRAVDGSGNPVVAAAFDPTQLTNLNNLLAGTSTQYASATQFGTVQAFAKSAPPTCGANEVLKSNGTTLSCVAGSASLPSAGASATNTIDSTNFAQVWNWSTATTQVPMSMAANALTTGSVLKVSTSSASLNSTNGLVNVANTSASTSGVLARFQSNSTSGSGLTILANGNVGIGTTSPSDNLTLYKAFNPTFKMDNGGTNSFEIILGSSGVVLGSNGDNGTTSADLILAADDGTSGHTSRFAIKADTGNVGIGTVTPRGRLDVQGGAFLQNPQVSNASSTINFATGNIQYTNSNCGAFQMNNLRDGGEYTFIVKGASSTTCSFTAFSDAGTTALTVHLPPDLAATTASKHTIFNLIVGGSDVYIAWTPGY